MINTHSPKSQGLVPLADRTEQDETTKKFNQEKISEKEHSAEEQREAF